MSKRMTLLPALALASVSLACGNGEVRSAAPTSTPTPSSASALPTVTPTAATSTAVASSPVDHLRGVGSARQVIKVAASRYGTSYATLTAYRKTATGWVKSLGPWTARIGRNGFAAPGKKHEGDGRTPTGSYGFGSFFFGVNAKPSGIRYTWRHAYTYDVWDDDSASARYNLWTNRNRHYPGRNPEPMHVSPAYNYGAVIAYNTARRPGLGSAIFLHVSHGASTAGCVTVPQAYVLKLLRWLNPKLGPRIIMGTTSAITK